MRFLFACFCVLSISLVLQACRLAPNQLIGEVSTVDIAAKMDGSGFFSVSKFDLNGAGLTVEVEVSSDATDSACIFSAGTPGTANYVEARLVTLVTSPTMHALQITVGTQITKTFGKIAKKKWQDIAFTISNTPVAGIYDTNVYINGELVPLESKLSAGVVGGPRDMLLGSCIADKSIGFNGMIDNLRFSARAKTQQEIQDTNVQFFPMPEAEGLLLYFDFNNLTSTSSSVLGYVGNSALSNVPAAVFQVTPMQRKGTDGYALDSFCTQKGITVKSGSGFGAPPFFNTTEGGFSQSVACKNGDLAFVVNHRWVGTGGISSITVKTSRYHFWRITAPGLRVEHRTWGGWNLLPRGADFLVSDKTTYRFTDAAVVIQAGAFGFIRIVEVNGILEFELGVDSDVCQNPAEYGQNFCGYHQTAQYVFDFSTDPVPEAPMGTLATQPGVLGLPPILSCPPPSERYRPDLLPPPPPPALNPVPTPPGRNPCDALPPARVEVLNAACARVFSSDSSSLAKCLADSCISNNPFSPPKISCEAQKLMKLTDPLFVIDPTCDSTCPRACSGNGICRNGTCACAAGFVGIDCGSPEKYPCFTVSSSAGPVVIRPLWAGNSTRVPITSAAFLSSLSSPFLVSDTTFMYLVRTLTSDSDPTPAYHLVFTNNNGNGNGDLNSDYASIGITISWVGAGSPQVTKRDYASTTTVTPQASSVSIQSTWQPSGYSIFAVSNLPAMTNINIAIAVTGRATSIDQILVGSAHLKETDTNLAAHKISKQGNSATITLNGGTCTDTCASINSCSACSARPECGWCVESARCVPGDRSGPWTYGICQNWRYTFDATKSRRLTQQLAFPVNPGFTDVFVTTSDSLDLPIEIQVQPRSPSEAVWDLAYVIHYDGSIFTMFNSYIDSILQFLTSYANLGVSFSVMNSGAAPYTLVRELSNPRDNFWMPNAVRRQPRSSNLPNGRLSVLQSLANLPIGWRAGSNRVMVIVANAPYVVGEVDINVVRNSLLNSGVIPVFLVTPAYVDAYTQLVSQLKQGLVLPLGMTATSQSITQATLRLLQKAAGYGSTYYTQAGIINTATWDLNKDVWQIYGLDRTILARFLIPTKSVQDGVIATSKLVMPGYGNAVVENVASDKPEAFVPLETVEVLEGKSVAITVNGRSLRDLLKTVPKIVTAPTKGSLNLVKAELLNGKPTGNFVPGDNIGVGAVSNDLLNRIFYTANSGTGGQTDFFDVSVTDTCSDSAVHRIKVNILVDNKPPQAEMVPISLKEDTPRIIVLEASDPNNDTLDFFITNTIHELEQEGKMIIGRAGTLYQYDPVLTTGRPADNDPNAVVVNSGDRVQDRARRLIFWPKRNVNSYADMRVTPSLLVKPCFQYKAVETTTPQKFESAPARVVVDILSVNDAPFVWQDPSLEYPNTSPYVWNTPSDVCWKDCTFDEDFGQDFPWNVPTKYLYLGGDDIERTDLDIIITLIDCDPQANLTTDIGGDAPLKVGTVIAKQPAGQLKGLVNFRPGPDRNNNNGGKGSYYCKIGYKVRDAEGVDSRSENVITISVNPVDDKPRIRSRTTDVTAVERIPKEFLIDAFDPEGDAFDVVVAGCRTPDRGTYEVCMDATCSASNRQTFTCADIDAAVRANGQGLKLQKRISKRQAPSAQGYSSIFTSGFLAAPTQGLNYQNLKLLFPSVKDAAGTTPAAFYINFNVVAINDAPVITVNNKTTAVQSFTLTAGERFTPLVSVNDVDIANGDISVNISVVPNNDGSFLKFKAAGKNVISSARTSVSLRGKLLVINDILTSFTFTPGKVDVAYTVTITASDNGNSGQCPRAPDGTPILADRLLYDPRSTCEQKTFTTVQVRFVEPNTIRTVAIAASGSAVFVIGLIGAALAVRAFNRQAESASYKPWDVFHESDAVLSNPLYEEGGVFGTSAIFEGQKEEKGILDSSSSSPSYVGLEKPTL